MSATTSRPVSRCRLPYGRRFVVSGLIGVAAVAAWYVAIDAAFRAWAHLPYHHWYLKNGAFISLAFAFATAAWSDLNRLTGLIALHPVRYFRDCLVLLAYPFRSLAAAFTPGRDSSAAFTAEGHAGSGALLVLMLARLWDVLIAAALSILVTAALLSWLVAVAPAQYVLHLLAGAPARLTLRSPMVSALRITDDEWTFVNAPRGSAALEGATLSGYAQRPVSMTNAFGAVVLWLLSRAGL